MSKPRIADVRLVAGLLQDEHESVEDLAREVIVRLDEARIERAKKEPHAGLLFKAAGLPLAVGPFGTDTARDRWVKAQGLDPGDMTVVVIKRPEEA